MQNEKQNPPKESIKLHVFSQEYLYYKSNLLETLKQFHKSTLIPDIYLTERCHKLTLNERITQVQIFGCGFKKIYHNNNISPYLKLDKIIILSIIDEQNLKELEQIHYLFPQIYLLTLQTTNSQNAQILRNSELKKSLRSIKELNLNFFTFLDGFHYTSKMQKSFLFKTPQEQKLPYKYERPSRVEKLGGYRSFLLSYPKLYEYELHFIKTDNQGYNSFVNDLQKELVESLGILQKHENQCKNLDKVSSPKIKCLILNRQIIDDLISPLLYGYYYGPLCEQFINREKLIEGTQKLASKGKMYNELFDKDFDQSAEYIQKLTNDKTALEGPFQTNYFYKAKHIIVSYEDPSPIQLSLHISCWKQTRQYGESRIKSATLQQDIANRIDEYERKVSNGDSISMIKDWILQASEEEADNVTEDELVKLGIITQMTGDLWFFHHKSIKKLLNDQDRKSRYQNFMNRRKSEIPTHQLSQKPQQQERSQLYRHEPKLVSICQQWINQALNDKSKQGNQKVKRHIWPQFDKKSINNDIMRNRESKLVLLIDGIVGYNELALLKTMIKLTTDKSVAILVQSFCNTQQYADYLMRPLTKNNNKNQQK